VCSLELDFTGSGEYVVEIAGSDFHGGVCSEKRQKKSDAAKVSVKKDGQGSAMTVRAAWAGGYGQVCQSGPLLAKRAPAPRRANRAQHAVRDAGSWR
jgi:hypothetical protein